MRDPMIRAGVVQANLDSLELLGSTAQRGVLDTLGPELVAGIRSTTRIGWLPLEVDAVMSEAVVREVGREGAIAWVRAALSDTFESPLFSNLLGPTLRLFGFGPAGLLKLAPRFLSQGYRNIGRVDVTGDEPGYRCLRIIDTVPAIADDDMYQWGLAETIKAFPLVVKVDAVVEHVKVAPDRVEWRVRWSAERAA